MQTETSRSPIETLRDHVVRLGDAWGPWSRQLGASALRSSAQTLTSTAQHLDQLAVRIEASAADPRASEQLDESPAASIAAGDPAPTDAA